MSVEEIYTYIAEQLKNAIEQYNRIARGMEGLDMFPERVCVMESEPEHSMGLRQFVIDKFSAFYCD